MCSEWFEVEVLAPMFCRLLFLQWQHCELKGPLSQMLGLFESLVAKYKPALSRRSDPGPPSPPVVPILSAIRLRCVHVCVRERIHGECVCCVSCSRLTLLDPKHSRILSLENGAQTIGNNDISMMYCEGVRRISFARWPHKNYM